MQGEGQALALRLTGVAGRFLLRPVPGEGQALALR